MPICNPNMGYSDEEDQEFNDLFVGVTLKLLDAVSKSNNSELSHEEYIDVKCRYGGYSSCHGVKKTCVSSRGIYSFPDNSYGIKWVGMHGMEDSICIVARHSDVDLKRVGPGFRNTPDEFILDNIAISLRKEIEGISKPNANFNESHEGPGLAFQKPFGVVSVNSNKDMVHEKSGCYEAKNAAEYDVIHFLRNKMLTNPAITMHDTVQTAISAFQLLCHEELKAEDICVSVCPKLPLGTTTLSTNEIKEHLALIKGRSMTTNKLKEHHPYGEILTRRLFTVKSSTPLDLRHVAQLVQERPCSGALIKT